MGQKYTKNQKEDLEPRAVSKKKHPVKSEYYHKAEESFIIPKLSQLPVGNNPTTIS